MSLVVAKDKLGRLPAEIRLAGWLGPTFFTSEARDGNVVTLATHNAALREHAHAQSLVVGTTRETQGPTPTAYAAFCVDPRTGSVVLVDLDAPHRDRFVNSRLDQFVASLSAFVAAWPRITESDEATVPLALDRLRSELAAIDAAALNDDDAFWPTALEMMSSR